MAQIGAARGSLARRTAMKPRRVQSSAPSLHHRWRILTLPRGRPFLLIAAICDRTCAAITITPGPVSNAASSAICISPTTSMGAGKKFGKGAAHELRPTRAARHRSRQRRYGILEWEQSRRRRMLTRTDCCSDSRACNSPTRTMLLGPAVAPQRADAIRRPPRRWS